MHVIYTIQNIKNLKIYVGQSAHYRTRWNDHIRTAKDLWLEKIASTHKRVQYVHKAMAKHGIESFEFQVLEKFETQEEADEAEKFWISFFNSRNPEFGYNLVPGGKKGVGCGPDHPLYGKPAANRLYTDKEEKVICDRYTNEQLTITKLAEIYECEQSTIHKMLQRNNVPTLGNAVFSQGRRYSPETEFKKGQPSPRRLNLPEDEIVKRYKAGESTTIIANDFGCHRTIIIRLLNRLGIQMRKGKLTQQDKVNICKEYNKLKSARKVAEKFGVNKSTILRITKNMKSVISTTESCNI